MTRDVQYYVPNNNKVLLMMLLLLLNIVIRIPSILHEKGYDSFFIHALANSISIFGAAEWWINWLSIFGLYPYSYASSVPFILSGLSQLTGIEMEKTILLFCVMIGMFSMFTSYILARIIYSSFIPTYVFTLFFSIAPGVMVFTTWEVSTRGLFIVYLPFFIYVLIKKNTLIKKYFLLILCFILIFATHHYAYFLIPIGVIYGILVILKRNKYLDFKESYISIVFLFLLIIIVIVPFFTRSLITSGSRYDWIIIALITNIRYSGPIIIFICGGLTYLLLQKNKNINTIFILFLLIVLAPTLYSHTYGPFLIVLFVIFIISFAFNNVICVVCAHKNKLLLLYIIFIIFSFVAFSGYYNHFRTGDTKSFWQMSHETYTVGSWGKEYISDNSRGLDTGFETGRVFAVSEGHPLTPSLGPGNLAYGFINESYIEYVSNSIFSKEYYFDGPYSVKSGTTFEGRMEWLRQYGKNMNDLKNFEYYVEYKYQYKPITQIIQLESNKVYDNTRFAIWEI